MTRPLLLVLVVAQTAMACGIGCMEWQGNCACEAKSENIPLAPSFASDEVPPKHPEPAYQRGEFVVDMPISMAGQDAKLDADRDKATAEGKTAAGVPR